MKTLLLSSIPPCTEYTAGLFLKTIKDLQISKGKHFYSAAVVNPTLVGTFQSVNSLGNYLQLTRPLENGISARKTLPSPLAKTLTFFRELYRLRKLSGLIDQVVEFGKKNEINNLLVLLESPYIIRMALPVAKKLDVPIYSLVFDDPSWHMKAAGMSPAFIKKTTCLFNKTLKNSVRSAAISTPMADLYAKKFSIDTVEVQHCLDKTYAAKNNAYSNDSDYFVIAFGGQIYATEAWATLTSMLNAVNWVIGGKKIKIKCLGNHIFINSSGHPQNINFLGWRSQKEAINIFSKCDLLYCPYPFQLDMEKVYKYSFPSKLSGYFASGRPVIFHGPKDSAPFKFFKKNDAGLTCHTLYKSSIFNEIEKIIVKKNIHKHYSERSLEIFEKFFTLEKLERKINSFLK